MKDLLKRGIAVHHSGILPIIKEVCLISIEDSIHCHYGYMLIMAG